MQCGAGVGCFFVSLELCDIKGLQQASRMAFRGTFRGPANRHFVLPCRRKTRGSIGGVRHGNRGSCAAQAMSEVGKVARASMWIVAVSRVQKLRKATGAWARMQREQQPHGGTLLAPGVCLLRGRPCWRAHAVTALTGSSSHGEAVRPVMPLGASLLAWGVGVEGGWWTMNARLARGRGRGRWFAIAMLAACALDSWRGLAAQTRRCASERELPNVCCWRCARKGTEAGEQLLGGLERTGAWNGRIEMQWPDAQASSLAS